ncbi:hypothetical protein [Sporosarcina pasteurii]|uniref:Uncharacterized protein n=1 Tax=Sporosarcina pasteurii TaxID=1474 RepID=A0A380CFU1_SPOPA|nr:hypothetical protein [Sporosarcina pasteurii]MDS9473207.1 hypothetical protein [Sporosarcina pasteurii]QBQ06940.1 hypothetical protein E2C16_15450 [Sporosarcina pasteurii]SUJ18450.1 Uncharacterised protein [Sporosarcina pasteurii]
MVTVQEVLSLAIEIDMIGLAHRVFWAVSEGKVYADDASEKLDEIEYDEQAISDMVERNLLNIGKIKLYAVQTNQPGLFAFYYSEDVLDAYSLHQEMYREKPRRLTNASHLMGKSFDFNETGKSEILYVQRKEVVAFPFYLGHAWAGERRVYRMY